jgi:hypothetical protein
MTEREVLRLLKMETERTGSIRSYSKLIGVPMTTVAAVLAGHRPLNDPVLKALGLRRVVSYEGLRSIRRSR